MEKYVFYTKDSTTKVFAKNSLSPNDISQLKEDGFKKYPIEFEAESKQQAIAKLNENGRESLDSLSQFTGNHLFMIILMVGTFILIYLLR